MKSYIFLTNKFPEIMKMISNKTNKKYLRRLYFSITINNLFIPLSYPMFLSKASNHYLL